MPKQPSKQHGEEVVILCVGLPRCPDCKEVGSQLKGDNFFCRNCGSMWTVGGWTEQMKLFGGTDISLLTLSLPMYTNVVGFISVAMFTCDYCGGGNGIRAAYGYAERRDGEKVRICGGCCRSMGLVDTFRAIREDDLEY